MRVEIPERDLFEALKLIRDFRVACLVNRWDPRAARVALKYAMFVDDYHSGQKLTPDEDHALTRMAQDLFRRAKRGFEGRRTT